LDKQTVGIIFGGESTEHEVSRRSAVHIIASLDKSKYDYKLIEIAKDTRLYVYDNCDETELCREIVEIENKLEKSVVSISEKIFKDNGIDVVFSVIHGTGGEDGVLQGFLEMCGIPYAGSGVASSAVGFDKAMAKVMFANEGIPQADYICTKNDDIDYDALKKEISEKLGYPVFVKPSNGGSSVGIYKVREENGLVGAIENASRYDRKIIIEGFVPGREFECAVIGGFYDVDALGVGEIVPCNEFYDYNAKYVDEDSLGIIPAPIDKDKIDEIKELSIRAFKAIDCFGLARVDFFMTEDGKVVLNEINTMPGFTSISMYPKLWKAAGNDAAGLITRLIELAFERKEKYSFLKDYQGDNENV
jgi:D-alanine-D-alanine ligase